jgi:heterodisulfide reductase subunit C
MYRFVADKRDVQKDRKIRLSLENGLWACTHCNACLTSCPTQTQPLEAIVKLRQKVVEEKRDRSMGVRRVRQYASDIYHTGQVNKALLPLRVGTSSKTPAQLVLAWKKILQTEWFLLKHKYFVWPFPKKVHRIRFIRKLMTEGKQQLSKRE